MLDDWSELGCLAAVEHDVGRSSVVGVQVDEGST